VTIPTIESPATPHEGGQPPPPPHPPAGERPSAPRGRGALVSAAVAAVVAAGVAVPVTLTVADQTGGQGQPAATSATSVDDAPARSVTDIAAAVSPSVASVQVRGPQGQGGGSAVIHRADGYLVTNAHVVAGAADVEVTLPDGTSSPAEVVGADEVSDLAVLRVAADDLPVPTYADGLPEVGDAAVAIGSPFGLEGSVTNGIVSAVGRSVSTPGAPLVDMIQTDAAINPGNSGGALVDDAGRIVGINTAILSATGANNGIGFAIPVTTVQSVADQLIESGSVEHAFLGIQGITVDAAVAELYGVEEREGAVVAAVEPGSPAAEAGLQEGDVIRAIGEEPVESMEELAARIQAADVGTTTTVTVVRDGEESTIEVDLAARPDQDAAPTEPEVPTAP
jgi:S1-C subfamily serine protease